MGKEERMIESIVTSDTETKCEHFEQNKANPANTNKI